MYEVEPRQKPGVLLAEGKTKLIWAIPSSPDLVIIESKDDVTAGDGKRHDVILGKGALANATTCNVFRLLARHGISTAFQQEMNETAFAALRCEMLPYE